MRSRRLVAAAATFAALASTAEADAALIAKGNAAVQARSLVEARAIYDAVLEAEPAHVAALNNRGVVAMLEGRLGDAITDLTAALQIAPEDGTVWNNRANANCTLKEVEAAAADRVEAMNAGRFTVTEAQAGLRSSGFYSGPADGIWVYDSEKALIEWTRAGCPDAPATRLID